jgi:glycosidase
MVLAAFGCAPSAVQSTSDSALTEGKTALHVPAFADRQPEDEIIYFMLPDRFENGDPSNDTGGIPGGRLDHGFDPTDPGFYHGGDLKGLTARLDYLQALGVTAVWVGPIFKNAAVQGPEEVASAGYHGYWIDDFLDVDPHLGTKAEFKAFVEAAHGQGMKVYMDIITNHTADYIAYEECSGPNPTVDPTCPYRTILDYPFTRRGGPEGPEINVGFKGDDAANLTAENYAKLTDPTWAYTPFIQPGKENAKNPAWLNDPIYYSNRGNTTFEGEDGLHGDFVGLDDINTEHPRVVEGFIEIYKYWISEYRIDGFRIDTVKHVRPEFWRAWAPEIMAHAKAEGIPHFHMFGEAYDYNPVGLAKLTTESGMPTVIDFAFQGTVRDVLSGSKPSAAFADLFYNDGIYAGGAARARQLPTFLGNHDMGRLSMSLKASLPNASESELLQRLALAHAKMMFLRGVPVIYSGDEQGFVSDSNDKGTRETLFPSQVPSYLDNDLLGTDRTHAQSQFDTEHPLFKAISAMASVRQAHIGLRRGEQTVRHAEKDGGLLVVTRLSPAQDFEYLIAFNAETRPRQAMLRTDGRVTSYTALSGVCPGTPNIPGRVTVEVPALGFIVCQGQLG